MEMFNRGYHFISALAMLSLQIVIAHATLAATPSPIASASTPLIASNLYASSYDPVNGVPKHAVDGDLSTRWAASGAGQSLTLDWGSRKTVKQLRIAFYQGTARVYTFSVLSSDDNRSFLSLGNFKSSGRTNELETFGVTTTGRYLRIVGYGNTVNGWTSLNEVQAFGDAIGALPPPAAGSVAGKLLLNDGFESALLDTSWLASGNDTAAAVLGTSRSGSRSLQLKLGPTDGVKYRTELTRGDGTGNFNTGSTYCIGFSLMVKNWTAIPAWNSLFQTHSVPNSWTSGYRAGRNSITLSIDSPNTLALAVVKHQNTGAGFGSAAGETVARHPLKFGAWYDYVMRFRPSKDVDGIIEVWVNGTEVYSQVGQPNMDLYDEGGQSLQNNVYLKLGIYKSFADLGSQELYYDNVKIVKNPTSCAGGSIAP